MMSDPINCITKVYSAKNHSTLYVLEPESVQDDKKLPIYHDLSQLLGTPKYTSIPMLTEEVPTRAKPFQYIVEIYKTSGGVAAIKLSGFLLSLRNAGPSSDPKYDKITTYVNSMNLLLDPSDSELEKSINTLLKETHQVSVSDFELDFTFF